MKAPAGAQNVLAVFLKFPTPGKVKTRLAAGLGDEQAASLYRQWITDVLNPLQVLRPASAILGYFTGAEADGFSPWSHLVDEWLPQPAGDLGRRLDFAFQTLHRRFAKVAAIGTDCLDLSADLVTLCFQKLDAAEVVLGPSSDGGYYLIGTSRRRPGLFDGVRWSSNQTLRDQLQVCTNNGWNVEMLPVRSDIDTWEDWREHCLRKGFPIPPNPTPLDD